MRVIARLNMGGPALHVSYLSRGLDERGLRDDAARRRAGAWRGLDGVRRARRGHQRRARPAAAQGDLAGLRPDRDLAAAAGDQAREAAHPAHAHRQGGRRRTHRRAAGGERAPARDRPHLPRACASRLLRSRSHASVPRDGTSARAPDDTLDRRRSRRARRPRRARSGAAGEVLGHPARHRSRSSDSRRPSSRVPAPLRRARGSVRRRLDRTDDCDQAPAGLAALIRAAARPRDRGDALPRRRRPRSRGRSRSWHPSSV